MRVRVKRMSTLEWIPKSNAGTMCASPLQGNEMECWLPASNEDTATQPKLILHPQPKDDLPQQTGSFNFIKYSRTAMNSFYMDQLIIKRNKSPLMTLV